MLPISWQAFLTGVNGTSAAILCRFALRCPAGFVVDALSLSLRYAAAPPAKSNFTPASVDVRGQDPNPFAAGSSWFSLILRDPGCAGLPGQSRYAARGTIANNPSRRNAERQRLFPTPQNQRHWVARAL